eukprot:GHVS01041766.1.p1 GENE.GHVS01041766.1~~GHVS01041766.1.p1  ORF type:complete len:241 (-),score=62.76 GHVS01041766.1:76-762(-)
MVSSTTSDRLRNVQQTQQQRHKRRGLSSSLLNPVDIQRRAVEEVQQLEELGMMASTDNDDAGYGLLQNQFTSTGGGSTGDKPNAEIDKHLEAYLEERLGTKNLKSSEVAEPLSRLAKKEAELYQVPLHLQCKDKLSEEADKMNWVTGLVEVPLPLESKLRNIEATEKAKRQLLKLGKTSAEETVDPNSMESIKTRAFGSRFLSLQKPTTSLAASDDLALDRFRKKMKK